MSGTPDREPPRRALVDLRVPEPRHARHRLASSSSTPAAPPAHDEEARSSAGQGPAAVHPPPHQGSRSPRTCPTRSSRPSTATWSRPSGSSTRTCEAHYRQALLRKDRRRAAAGSKIEVLEALLRLRQAACHPGLIDPERADEPSRQARHAPARSWPRSSRKATRSSSSRSSPASWPSSATRLDAEGLTYEYLDGQTRNRAGARRALPDRPRLPASSSSASRPAAWA